jgi:OOP family OmpA-OmpF porin
MSKIFNSKTLPAMLLLGLTALNTAHAREATPGYWQDSYGNIVKNSYGECVRSSAWTPESATIVGCDGVTADTTPNYIRGQGSGLLAAIVMPSTAMFEFDKAELTESGKSTIESYRDKIVPELATAYAAVVVGHTDSTGDDDYNLKLSLKRAEAVRDYLVDTGADPDKLEVLGRGENDPIASNDTKEGRAENRRVEVLLLGEMRDLDTMVFPSVALFERRSWELTEGGVAYMEKERANAIEKFKRAAYVEIIGHTDDVGDDDYNQELSEKRAMSVYNYLAGTGMDVSMVVVKGMGEKSPIASNLTEEGRAQNRRVEVILLGRER